MPAPRPKQQILIIGGGYVGTYTALGLERALEPEEADIYLVAPENFMLYQPLLPEVASGSVEPRHAVIPLRQVLPHTEVIHGQLCALDHPRRTATLSLDGSEPRQMRYDTIVLGLGSVTRMLPVPGLVEHAVGFQTLAEAIHLRNQVLARLEAAEASSDRSVRERALTFVFVGGGYAGVEALAELESLACAACRSYRSISPRDMRWILVEATDRILSSMDSELADRVAGVLRERGIEIRLRTELKSAVRGTLQLSDGDSVQADTLVWMPGVTPHPLARELGLPCDDQGRLIADQCLRVRGQTGAWTAGDTAAIPDEDGGFHPPTAQHAEREARQLARNIARSLRGQEPEPFRYRTRGEFVTLGNREAVARVFRLQLRGGPAWALRRGYYVARMPSTERRLRLLTDWTIGLPFPVDITQLGSAQHPDQPLARAASSH